MTELTAYLSNIMGSVLLGLPDQMKEIIYLDALIHASSNILVFALNDPSRLTDSDIIPGPSTRSHRHIY